MWDALKKYDQAHDIIQAGTQGGDDTMTSETGIVLGHAYVVVGVVELSTGDRLVKLRNPWGSEKYIGDWSDKSDKWTDKLREEAGAVSEDDGIIFLAVEDYHKEFYATMVNKNMEGVQQDYFLMLGDDGSKASDEAPIITGNTKHKLTIESSVTQKVRVITNVWEDRGFPMSCRNYGKNLHVVDYSWNSSAI